MDGSGTSLLQATANRLLEIAGGWQGLWVVTSSALESGVREQLPELPRENLLAEPEGRDTAPAVAWSTMEIVERSGVEAVLGFFPADHWIGDRAVFEQTLAAAKQLAEQQSAIVTLGIKPSYPATGYGYIEQGESAGEFGGISAYRVKRFAEKPNRETAEQFLATGRFSWNSGMFVFKADTVLNELTAYAPDIVDPLVEKSEVTRPPKDRQG